MNEHKKEPFHLINFTSKLLKAPRYAFIGHHKEILGCMAKADVKKHVRAYMDGNTFNEWFGLRLV